MALFVKGVSPPTPRLGNRPGTRTSLGVTVIFVGVVPGIIAPELDCIMSNNASLGSVPIGILLGSAIAFDDIIEKLIQMDPLRIYHCYLELQLLFLLII